MEAGGEAPGKLPIDVDEMLRRIEEAVRTFPKAALFELAEEGYGAPFEVLVACIISIRTLDETTLAAARRLFARARSPEELAALPPEEIDALIHPARFHEGKARQIRDIAQRVTREHGGALPCEREALLDLHGVGPKCANLTLGIACGDTSGIGVDVHVHRVTNRWGYVATRSPEATMRALEDQLPRRHWLRINALLVPFGKRVCTPSRPRCSSCPVLARCRQVGVERPR